MTPAQSAAIWRFRASVRGHGLYHWSRWEIEEDGKDLVLTAVRCLKNEADWRAKEFCRDHYLVRFGPRGGIKEYEEK